MSEAVRPAAAMPDAPAAFVVAPGGALRGRCTVPGDKSISQRAAILGALAAGTTRIEGFLEAADPRALLAALAACGVRHRFAADGALEIEGRAGWIAPAKPLDLGNSGTGLRLLAGALAGQPFQATLVGDASLSRRPMERVAAPLRAMGAEVDASGGTPPLRIRGRRPLAGVEWTPEVASAQVKSAVLIAGLAAEGAVAVREPVPTRDHTERMLRAFGVDCARAGDLVRLGAERALRATTVTVPGDLSSAAFLVIGAAMTPGAELVVEGVGLNPTRTAFIEVLRAMGAELEVEAVGAVGDGDRHEPVGRITVRGRALRATAIAGRLAQQAIDELPMLLIAAATATGTTRLADAAELRHKESDRLANTAAGLAALGVPVELAADGMTVAGRASLGVAMPGRAGEAHATCVLDAHDDHRLAMAFALAALRAERPIEVRRAAAIATSFPGFHRTVRGLGLVVESSS